MNRMPTPAGSHPRTSAEAAALMEVAKSVNELVAEMKSRDDELRKRDKRIGLYVVAVLSVVSMVAGACAFLLYRQAEQQSQLAELARSVEELKRTAYTTQTTVDETRATIEAGPAVDVEIRPATSATPSTSAVPTSAVITIKPVPPRPQPQPPPSIEIPVPMPSSIPEPNK